MSVSEFDFSELKKYAEQVEKLDENQREKLMEDCTKQVAKALLRGAVNNTPAPTGRLRLGWTGNVKMKPEVYVEGQKVQRLGNSYQLTEKNIATSVDNNVFYASYVEYGHRQQPGRYVPAIGKRLKASWVEGHHMLKMAEEDVNAQQQRILSLKVNKELKKYFGGDA